jgi:hypothetical protein
MNPAGAALAAPSATYRPIAGRSALLVAVYFCALSVGCLALGRWLPFPDVPVVREKLAHLARHGDEYDVLFVGSSRLYFQVLPSIFDQVAREEGLPVRSFNAAVAAMAPPEDNYLLDQILRQPHGRLRWVVLEIMPMGSGKGDPTLSGTRRYSYWHDWPRTWLLTRRFLADFATGRETRDWYEFHRPVAAHDFSRSLAVWLDNLELFAENHSNLGRGQVGIMTAIGPLKKPKEEGPKDGTAWDGWTFPKIAKVLAGERLANYQRDYADLQAMKDRLDPGDAPSWDALREKIDRLRAAKIQPILIIPPKVGARPYCPPELRDQSLPVFDFCDPGQYAELFALDHRLDGQHLNYEGAELFSRLLARRFVEAAKGSGPAR